MRLRNKSTVVSQWTGVTVLWSSAAACFLIAAATGALLRFGFVTGLPWGLDAGHLRHAHSHLMSFSWTTPAVMALWLSLYSSPEAPHDRLGLRAAFAALVLGCLTFPFFLVAGYGRVALFGAELPFSSMLSGVTMISWYLFTIWWLRVRRRQRTGDAVHLLDISLIGLCLSTVGAWGRAVLVVVEVGTAGLADAAVQLFLGAFMHGWLIVGVLGLAFSYVEALHERGDAAPSSARGRTSGEATEGRGERGSKRGLAWVALLLGLPGASLAGMIGTGGQTAGFPGVLVIGLGALMFLLGLSWYAWRLARIVVAHHRWEWLPFLGFLALVIAGLAGSSFPPLAAWGERAGLRIVYLHILTLGVATVGLVTAARVRWGRGAAPSPWSFAASTLLLLVGLFSLTLLWPGTASAEWRRAFAAWTSIPPILAFVKSVLPARTLPSGKDSQAVRLS